MFNVDLHEFNPHFENYLFWGGICFYPFKHHFPRKINYDIYFHILILVIFGTNLILGINNFHHHPPQVLNPHFELNLFD